MQLTEMSILSLKLGEKEFLSRCLRYNNLKDLLLSAFNWEDSIEGFEYWNTLYKKIK